MKHLINSFGVVDGGGQAVGPFAGLIKNGLVYNFLPDGLWAQEGELTHQEFFSFECVLLSLDILARVRLVIGVGFHILKIVSKRLLLIVVIIIVILVIEMC
jgi:hypothetical protein